MEKKLKRYWISRDPKTAPSVDDIYIWPINRKPRLVKYVYSPVWDNENCPGVIRVDIKAFKFFCNCPIPEPGTCELYEFWEIK